MKRIFLILLLFAAIHLPIVHSNDCIQLESTDCQDGLSIKTTPLVYDIIYNGNIDSAIIYLTVCMELPQHLKLDTQNIVFAPNIYTHTPIFDIQNIVPNPLSNAQTRPKKKVCFIINADSTEIINNDGKIAQVGFTIDRKAFHSNSSVYMSNLCIYSNKCTILSPWLLENTEFWLTPDGTPWLIDDSQYDPCVKK